MTSSPTTSQAIDVTGLRKCFGEREALRGMDLQVAAGSFFGLLGPNGAGKTTSVGILTTLLRPDAGRARLLGLDVVEERTRVRAMLGVVFQEPSLDPELTPREHLRLYARLYHLDRPKQRADEMLERMHLLEEADRLVGTLSGGMKRRLEIGRGGLHEPRLLFLDEPTTGLDVAARARVWQQLRDLHAQGDTTLFLTTHSMEEAEALCDELAIMDAGELVVQGSPEQLKGALGGDVVRLVVARVGPEPPRFEAVEGVVRVTREQRAEGSIVFRVTVRDGPRRLAALVEVARELEIEEVTLHRPSLEHVFLRHTGHEFEESDA